MSGNSPNPRQYPNASTLRSHLPSLHVACLMRPKALQATLPQQSTQQRCLVSCASQGTHSRTEFPAYRKLESKNFFTLSDERGPSGNQRMMAKRTRTPRYCSRTAELDTLHPSILHVYRSRRLRPSPEQKSESGLLAESRSPRPSERCRQGRHQPRHGSPHLRGRKRDLDLQKGCQTQLAKPCRKRAEPSQAPSLHPPQAPEKQHGQETPLPAPIQRSFHQGAQNRNSNQDTPGLLDQSSETELHGASNTREIDLTGTARQLCTFETARQPTSNCRCSTIIIDGRCLVLSNADSKQNTLFLGRESNRR